MKKKFRIYKLLVRISEIFHKKFTFLNLFFYRLTKLLKEEDIFRLKITASDFLPLYFGEKSYFKWLKLFTVLPSKRHTKRLSKEHSCNKYFANVQVTQNMLRKLRNVNVIVTKYLKLSFLSQS